MALGTTQVVRAVVGGVVLPIMVLKACCARYVGQSGWSHPTLVLRLSLTLCTSEWRSEWWGGTVVLGEAQQNVSRSIFGRAPVKWRGGGLGMATGPSSKN
eukprot:3644309-Amphidinium_carterae.6